VRLLSLFLVGFALSLSSCVAPIPQVPAHPDPTRYFDPHAWLCLPGRDDACAGDLSATEIHPDGTRTIERRPAATDPKVDCFYVYPTVDLDLVAENHETFDDLSAMTAATVAQAARFREVCSLYVPLYRQVTIGSYLHKDSLEPRLAFAFSDVEAAFREYLADRDHGRPLVLLGHSQGGDMVVRLLQRFFDDDPAMRARLLLALPLGANVEVPRGKTVGATFAHIPVCTKADETGCVVAYRSGEMGAPIAPGLSAPKPGNESVCVNPANFEQTTPQPLARAYFSMANRKRRWMRGVDGVETPFVELSEFYSAQCAAGPDGFRYLGISVVGTPGDSRTNVIDFERMPLRKQFGLHVLDFQFPQGDLIDLVARRAAALPPAR
jgi:hypothetical protein